MTGISHQGIALREKGATRIKADEEIAFAKAFEVPVEHFRKMVESSNLNLRTAEHAGIPLVNKAPAGPAWDFEKHGVSTRDGTAYMAREEGERSDDLFAVEVTGDSMEPALVEGDRVVLWPVPKGETGIPPHVISGQIVYCHFREEEGGGSCIARLDMTGESDPERGLAAKLVKLNTRHKSRSIYLTDLDQLAIAVRLSRKLWSM